MQNIGATTRDNFYIQNSRQNIGEKTIAPKTPNWNKNDLLIGSISAIGLLGLSTVIISQRGKIKNLTKQINKLKNSNLSSMPPQQPEEVLIPYKILPLKDTLLFKKFTDSKTSFLQFITECNEPASKVKEFLFGITSEKETAAEFIEEIIKNPRESAKNLNLIKNKTGGYKNLSEWLMAPGGYQEAYNKYIREKVPDMTIEEMIKLSPNWHIYFLKTKANNLTFGELPEEFKKLGDYSHFVNWLANMRGEFRQGEKVLKEYGGQHMEIQSLKEGLSGKYPLKIQFIDMCTNKPKGKPYILKIQELYGCNNNEFAKESIAYRSDSVFINAQIDHYLNLHKCENTVKFHYFDYASNSGLYEFINGKNCIETENIMTGNKLLHDLNLLGIYYNDVCATNILKYGETYKIIDIGDSSFIDPLRPGVKGLQFEVPNWCGIAAPNYAMMFKQ